MKQGIVLFALFVLGYIGVYGWQSLLAGWLADNNCTVLVSDPQAYARDRFVGAVCLALCLPVSIAGLSLLNLFAPQRNQREIWILLGGCVLFSHLGALLRSMIIVKIRLQEAFANGEIYPQIDLLSVQFGQWMFYGMLSALVVGLMVFVPFRLLAESSD